MNKNERTKNMKSSKTKKAISLLLTGVMATSVATAADLSYNADTSSGATATVAHSEKNDNGDVDISASFSFSGNQKSYDVGIDLLDTLGNSVYSYKTRITLGNKDVKLPIAFSVSGASAVESAKLTAYADKTAMTVYASPNGTASASGTAENPTTLANAIAIAETATSEFNTSATVILKSGRYEISQTQAIDYDGELPLTVKAEEEGKVYFSSGKTINGSSFRALTDTEKAMFPESARESIKAFDLSSIDCSLSFKCEYSDVAKDYPKSYDYAPIYTTLYANGVKASYAKLPKSGWYEDATSLWGDDISQITVNNFKFSSPNIGNWSNYNEAWVRGYFAVEWSICTGVPKDIADGTISLARYYSGHFKPSDFLGYYTSKTNTNKKWMIYNLPEALTDAGEYVIKDNILYYLPKTGENLSETTLLLNTNKNTMLNLTGSEKLKLSGITFESTAGYFIEGTNLNNVQITDCIFRNNTANAINVTGEKLLIKSCEFYNVDGQPLSISGGNVNTLTSSDNVVENCYFHDINEISRTGAGAVALGGVGVTLKHNKIKDTPHLAISYSGNNHVIEYNEITDCNTDHVGDAGLIYSGNNLSNLGTVIKNNYFHDTWCGLGAVYYDDRLSHQTTEGNVFENFLGDSGSAWFVHGGVNNKFVNNICVNIPKGAGVRDTNLVTTANVVNVNDEDDVKSVEINYWDTKWFKNGEANDYKLQNEGTNHFLGHLLGYTVNGVGTYLGVDYTSNAWQSAYGSTLSYINNKTNRNAEGTVVTGNSFVGLTGALGDNTAGDSTIWTIYYKYNPEGSKGMLISDLAQCTDNTENLSSVDNLSDSAKTLYNDVTTNAGLYK